MGDHRQDDRELDVVLFGATGFVGRLVARYLAVHAPADARIALAGRSAERLTALRDALGQLASDWPVLVADASDQDALDRLARQTCVVATTVGPYTRYGMPLVAACAEAGTSYADLTGEVLFVRETLDTWDAVARARGARVVHSCGFDSVPSDLGVLLLHEQVQADGEGELEDTTLVVTQLKGGVGGGTIDSARSTVAAVVADRSQLRLLADPYALSPDRSFEPEVGGVADRVRIRRDRDHDRWLGPFVMATFNTRIVRLSNSVQDWAYGRHFRYREFSSYGSGPLAPARAATVGVGLAGLAAGLAFPPTRALLDRVLPKPGEGPDEETLRGGRFRMEIETRTSTGARFRAVVAAAGDPGYTATAVMLGESALCLAFDRDRLPDRSGVLTPATAMGDLLVQRLRAAGFTMTVERL
ncbi:MAG TPA: saccharopine dehydrogenase NADP-binding domain-containing protein [Actinomycetes bacterium]|nr:saccharopine dehydrogenase NADP-binding domain-containing protein [Actinomycetes bacterium]